MDELKRALSEVRMDAELRQTTLDRLEKRRQWFERRRRTRPLRWAAACACMLLLLLAGGYVTAFQPVSYISVDVNPSVELALNRLDRVLDVTAYNEDGALIVGDLDLRGKTYTAAIETLLEDPAFAAYLTDDAALTFTVVSGHEETLLAGIEGCRGYGAAGGSCHGADAGIVDEAHASGLSCGKYQAYLTLSQYDSSITPADCQSMTMRQLRDRIAAYAEQETSSPDATQAEGAEETAAAESAQVSPESSCEGTGQYRHQGGHDDQAEGAEETAAAESAQVSPEASCEGTGQHRHQGGHDD